MQQYVNQIDNALPFVATVFFEIMIGPWAAPGRLRRVTGGPILGGPPLSWLRYHLAKVVAVLPWR